MTDRIDSAAGCPDAERLAAFLDGRLPPAERQQVEEHLADCAACYDLFVEAARIGASLPERRDERVRGWPFRRTLLVSAAGLATAAALWLMLAPPAALVRVWDTRSRPELAEMVGAVGDTRRIEARITGGFAWGPIVAPRRAGDEAPDVSPEVQIAAGRLALRVERERSASTLAALGAGQLAAGRIDSAVDALEEAVALDASMAAAWSDLGAALLARSTLAGHAAEVPHALDVIGNALELDPDLPEGRFNHALAFERMGLIERAITSWEDYLAIDDSSAWADEARSRLAELRKRHEGTTDGDLQPLRERLFDDALPQWAERTLAGDGPGAGAALAEARGLRDALTAASPDRLAADAVVCTERSGTALLRGLVAYGRARRAYAQGHDSVAGPAFEEAVRELDEAACPLALAARLYGAIVAYRANDRAAARRALASLLPTASARSYFSVAGSSAAMLGLLATARGEYDEADRWYRMAQPAYARAREPGNEAYAFILLATNDERQGKIDWSWERRLAALARSNRVREFLQSARSALRADLPEVAALLQERGAAIARARGELPNEIDALRLQALTYASMERRETAARLIAKCRALLGSGGDGTWRTRLAAEVDLVEAWNADAPTAQEALPAATRAVEYFSAANAAFRLREALVARARVHRLGGNPSGAHADLDRALEILARERDSLAHPADRLAFAGTVEPLEEELIEVELARDGPIAALRAVDRLRSWDLITPSSSAALEALLAALDSDAVILSYAVNDSGSYVWSVSRSGVTFARLAAGREELRRLAGAIRPDRMEPQIMRRLRALVLDPVSEALSSRNRLIVVADGPLHSVPFAALPGSTTRYLAQELGIAHAPSVSAAVASLQMPREPVDGIRAVLAVGNPKVDPGKLPKLRELPGARAEATAVARAYPSARLLVGGQATLEAMRAGMKDADVLHFAGHAVVNDLHPGDSYLAVLDGNGRAATAGAISRWTCPRLRLVVLAACQSLGGRSVLRRGPMGLARAFLQAGVPAVLASRWLVDDSASAALMTSFHEEYVRTGDPAVSLQRAQLSLIESEDPRLQDPAAWAGWTIVSDGPGRVLTDARRAPGRKE